jgi:hypothetical protein
MAKEFFATSIDYLAKDQFAERLFLEIGTFGRSLVYGLIKEDIAHLVERHGLATKLFCRSD